MKTTLTSPQIILAILLALNASAATRYLPPGTQDQTALFQSLINQSVSGDRIVVQAGNHYLVGTVVVNKTGLTISGDGGNAIRKAGNVSCIDLTAGATTIDGLYIDGGNRPELACACCIAMETTS
jgi:hypothetical protein